jgi:hypothetical protein
MEIKKGDFTMKNVRKDVQEKLLQDLQERGKTNPTQNGTRYETRRATHALRIVGGNYCFTSVGYDGTLSHTERPID